MNLWDVVLLAAIGAAFILAVRVCVRNWREGRGGCASCPSRGNCALRGVASGAGCASRRRGGVCADGASGGKSANPGNGASGGKGTVPADSAVTRRGGATRNHPEPWDDEKGERRHG